MAFRNLLTPYSTVLLEKLTGSHLANKFSTFYVTRRFITAFTSAGQLSLSWTRLTHSMPPTSHFLKIHFNIILPSRLGSYAHILSNTFVISCFSRGVNKIVALVLWDVTQFRLPVCTETSVNLPIYTASHPTGASSHPQTPTPGHPQPTYFL
jgi:hypothetical protein